MATSWKLSIACNRAEAEAITGGEPLIGPDGDEIVIVASEQDEAADQWLIDAYFDRRPDAATVATLVAQVPSLGDRAPVVEQLPDEDWVTLSQSGIAPVHAGRFYIHTASNRGQQPPATRAFQIDAGLAFGTGSHETTAGCVAMLDALRVRGGRFTHIADIGTGTGLLAFVALHLWPRAYATASDIDPVSIRVSRDNSLANGVAIGAGRGRLALCVAPGTDHPLIRQRAPYDLLIANILAGPLIDLAPAFAAIVAPGGSLILAGLLTRQEQAVIRAYRRVGFRLAERRPNGDWPTLRFVKRPRYGWQRPDRADGRTTQPPGDFGDW